MIEAQEDGERFRASALGEPGDRICLALKAEAFEAIVFVKRRPAAIRRTRGNELMEVLPPIFFSSLSFRFLTMERKRKVDLGDDDPPLRRSGGTSGERFGAQEASNKGENGGGGGGENGHLAATRTDALLRRFDETAKVSPYTGREYSKKYFDILEKRKG